MKIEAIVAGTTYDISNDVEFMLQAQSGMGMSPVRRQTEQGPMQHGVSDVGFRLGARTLQLKVALNAATWEETETRRDKLLLIFKPRDTAIALRKTLNNAAVRQIDCFFSKGLTFNTSDRKGQVHVEVIELLAPDPTFYDPVMASINFGLTGSSGADFEIPLEIPWNVGASTLNQAGDVTYTGTWRSYPIVTIYGPIDNCVITNETTTAKLDFTGSSLAAGESIVVDTRYGYKSVIRGSDGANLIAALTDDSDLATFCLEADPDAPDGVNSLRVAGTGVTEATAVYLAYFTRYVGI